MKEDQRAYLGVWGYVRPNDDPSNASIQHYYSRGVMECQPGPLRGGRIVTITPDNLHSLCAPPSAFGPALPPASSAAKHHAAVSLSGHQSPQHASLVDQAAPLPPVSCVRPPRLEVGGCQAFTSTSAVAADPPTSAAATAAALAAAAAAAAAASSAAAAAASEHGRLPVASFHHAHPSSASQVQHHQHIQHHHHQNHDQRDQDRGAKSQQRVAAVDPSYEHDSRLGGTEAASGPHFLESASRVTVPAGAAGEPQLHDDEDICGDDADDDDEDDDDDDDVDTDGEHIGLGRTSASTPYRKEPQHRMLTLEQKRELIRMFEEDHVKARDLKDLFSVGRTQVYAILKQRNNLKEEFSQAKTEHDKQAKRKVRFTGNEEIDEIVHKWYIGVRSKNMFITGTQLKEHAKVVADALGKRNFKASNGWLECFRKRHGIVIPRSRNSKDNAQLGAPDHEHGLSLQRLWAHQLQGHIRDYSEANIYCLDSTTLHYQATPRCIKTCLGEALHPPGPKVSVLLCASATGEKEPPLIVANVPLLPQFVQRMKIIFRRGSNQECELAPECIEEYIRGLSDRMRRESRSIVLFLLLPPHAHYVLGKHYANVKLVHWQRAVASSQPLQQGIFHRFKLAYRILALRNMIANGGPRAISFVDALQYISRIWNTNIVESYIRKAFWKAGFPVYLQNSLDNPSSREADIAEDQRELQRLVGVYSGDSGIELTRDYIDLEAVISRSENSSGVANQPCNSLIGCTSAYGPADDFGSIFGVNSSEDSLPLAPAITSYHGALVELRRLQQFALKANDYELHEIIFNARCAAEDRSASRIIAEKYLNTANYHSV